MKLTRGARGVVVAAAILAVTAAILGGFFREILFQEGNPLRLAIGVADACFAADGFGRVPGSPEKYVKRASSRTSFWAFMEKRGWTPVDQMGSELILENETQGLYVIRRMWTTHFEVFEIRRIVTKATDRSYNWSRPRDVFPTQ